MTSGDEALIKLSQSVTSSSCAALICAQSDLLYLKPVTERSITDNFFSYQITDLHSVVLNLDIVGRPSRGLFAGRVRRVRYCC